jgi:hypothetical protein
MLGQFLRAAGGLSTGPEIVSSAVSQRTTSTTNIVVTKAANVQVGDLMLIFGRINGTNGAWSALTGWTRQVTSGGCGLYSKIATSTDVSASSYTVAYTNGAGGGQSIAIMVILRKASFGVVGTVATYANPGTLNSITIPANKSIQFAFAGSNSDNRNATTPSGFTFLAGNATNGNNVAGFLWYKLDQPAGATSNITVTNPEDNQWNGFQTSVGPS